MINKAVIDVARTYHVLANLYLPKILYHLDNTVPLLAGYVTDSDYQRYRIFDEKFNIMVSGYIPASESPDLKARARPKFSKVDLDHATRTITTRTRELHQTQADHLGTRSPMHAKRAK